jgi:hypothetical protein
MNYSIMVQCTDAISGKVGTFIAGEDKKAVTPLMDGLHALYPWMRGNGWETSEHLGPWRVRRIATPSTEKGGFMAVCNRTACNISPAIWFNSSTRKYYCNKCGLKLNDFHPGLLVKTERKHEDEISAAGG